jgi:hypothetical protein
VQVKVLQDPVFLMVDLADEHPWRHQMEGVLQLGEQLLEHPHGPGLVAQDSTLAARQPGRDHQVHKPHMEVAA